MVPSSCFPIFKFKCHDSAVENAGSLSSSCISFLMAIKGHFGDRDVFFPFFQVPPQLHAQNSERKRCVSEWLTFIMMFCTWILILPFVSCAILTFNYHCADRLVIYYHFGTLYICKGQQDFFSLYKEDARCIKADLLFITINHFMALFLQVWYCLSFFHNI